MGLNRFAKGFFDPLIELYRPVPPLAWAPLIISVLGIDNTGKILSPPEQVATSLAANHAYQITDRSGAVLQNDGITLTTVQVDPLSGKAGITPLTQAGELNYHNVTAMRSYEAKDGKVSVGDKTYDIQEVTDKGEHVRYNLVDGDTIDVLIDLGFGLTKKERVRVAGIDTPESRTRNLYEKYLGLEAKAYLEEQLLEDDITIKTEKDGKYGRMLGWLYRKGETISIQERMIKSGYSESKNVRDVLSYLSDLKEARSKGIDILKQRDIRIQALKKEREENPIKVLKLSNKSTNKRDKIAGNTLHFKAPKISIENTKEKSGAANQPLYSTSFMSEK